MFYVYRLAPAIDPLKRVLRRRGEITDLHRLQAVEN